MDSVLEKLRKKKDEILRLQKEKAKREGQKEQLLQQLQKEFDVASIEEGKKMLKELDEKIEECRKKVKGLVDDMEEIILKATS